MFVLVQVNNRLYVKEAKSYISGTAGGFHPVISGKVFENSIPVNLGREVVLGRGWNSITGILSYGERPFSFPKRPSENFWELLYRPSRPSRTLSPLSYSFMGLPIGITGRGVITLPIKVSSDGLFFVQEGNKLIHWRELQSVVTHLHINQDFGSLWESYAVRTPQHLDVFDTSMSLSFVQGNDHEGLCIKPLAIYDRGNAFIISANRYTGVVNGEYRGKRTSSKWNERVRGHDDYSVQLSAPRRFTASGDDWESMLSILKGRSSESPVRYKTEDLQKLLQDLPKLTVEGDYNSHGAVVAINGELIEQRSSVCYGWAFSNSHMWKASALFMGVIPESHPTDFIQEFWDRLLEIPLVRAVVLSANAEERMFVLRTDVPFILLKFIAILFRNSYEYGCARSFHYYRKEFPDDRALLLSLCITSTGENISRYDQNAMCAFFSKEGWGRFLNSTMIEGAPAQRAAGTSKASPLSLRVLWEEEKLVVEACRKMNHLFRLPLSSPKDIRLAYLSHFYGE